MKNLNYKEKKVQLKNILTPALKDTVDLVIPLHVYYKNMMQEVKVFLEKKYELNKSELNLLVTLSTTENKTLAPTKLYEDLVFSSGGMTKLLKKLEMKDYITRIENPEDKRSKLVKITSVGESLAIDALNDVLKIEGSYFINLTDVEKSTLLIIFEKLADKK
ncbi:MarR family winged helix-turn-helix transcriptional regulator [Poseidonibacter antarcticus]|uniref:MarR family winged helix-turn-helix transcriptional regulator n=1 Tax=Poseidonibacter antarcticus TaxID=2478538 RepID=UPI000EF49110|nr:MarR family transcriptional regulator [Poseidonibacter antarcticus]